MIGSIGLITARNGEGLPTWVLIALIVCIAILLLVTVIRNK